MLALWGLALLVISAHGQVQKSTQSLRASAGTQEVRSDHLATARHVGDITQYVHPLTHFQDMELHGAHKNKLSFETFTARGRFVITDFYGGCSPQAGPVNVNWIRQQYAYRLKHCVPDPLNETVAVRVLADAMGNVVLTNYNDTLCASKVHRKYLNHSMVGGGCHYQNENPLYEIQHHRAPMPVMLTQRLYFDETCTGPHSLVATLCSTTNGAGPDCCINDPDSEKSYLVQMDFGPSYSSFIVGFYFEDAYVSIYNNKLGCMKSDPDVYKATLNSVPGYAECIATGNHYVYTTVGGSTEYSFPSSQPTGQPSFQPSSK
jgi:hypothetical protein